MLDGHVDHRGRVPLVVLRMPLEEFREMVEWMETFSEGDGATEDFRSLLNELEPPEVESVTS